MFRGSDKGAALAAAVGAAPGAGGVSDALAAGESSGPAEVERKAGLASGRAWGGRAELRHHNLVLKAIILLFAAGWFYSSWSWRQHADMLAEKRTIVFHERGGVTSVHDASEYQSGPSDEEIKGEAWKVIRWVAAAGSDNVDTAFDEAARMMTETMRADFDSQLMPRKQEIKDLNIYRKIEQARVEFMTDAEMPPGSKERPTRYDVKITGTLDTYRKQSNERIMTGPFSYYVRLVPLDRRTTEYPTALLVDGMDTLSVTATKATPTPLPLATEAFRNKRGAGKEEGEQK